MAKKKKKRRVLKFFCFLTAFITLFSCLYSSSNKILVDYAEKSFHSYISGASYEAFDVLLTEKYSYTDLISVDKNSNGVIVMVSADSYAINKIAAQIAQNAYEYLSRRTTEGVGIPLGAFTGIRLVSGFGKKINMKLVSVATVKSKILSSFEQAGINQTRHTLTLALSCEAAIVNKYETKTITDDISLLIYDNLIIGKVPNVLVSPTVIGSGSV